MTVSQLYQTIDAWYPTSLSCEWDHDGIMCMPRPEREVKKILLSLDATEEAVDTAIDGGYDVILTHHPMLFTPLYGISQEDGVGNLICRLIEHQISVFSFHTRMDAGEHGVNDALAKVLGLENIETVADFIRVGTLPKPMTFDEFAKQAKTQLNAQACKGVAKDAQALVSRIAVCGGEGKDFLPDAISAGADTYVTGNLSYHTMNSIVPCDIALLTAGHFETEQMICDVLKARLQTLLPSAVMDIFHCNTVFAI